MSRYSQLYIERGRPETDSQRARMRLYAAFWPSWRETGNQFVHHIRATLGVKIYAGHLQEFFLGCELRDLLDTVTETARFLTQHGFRPGAREWLQNANHIFIEENLAYRVGEDGVVHPHPDAEFEVNRASAIAALDDRRFAGARQEFEEAYRHVRNGEGKQALRMI